MYKIKWKIVCCGITHKVRKPKNRPFMKIIRNSVKDL